MRVNYLDPEFIPYWRVIDLDTGRQIQDCFWADDETGEYRVRLRNAKLEKYPDPMNNQEAASEVRRGRIRLVPPPSRAIAVLLDGPGAGRKILVSRRSDGTVEPLLICPRFPVGDEVGFMAVYYVPVGQVDADGRQQYRHTDTPPDCKKRPAEPVSENRIKFREFL